MYLLYDGIHFDCLVRAEQNREEKSTDGATGPTGATGAISVENVRQTMFEENDRT